MLSRETLTTVAVLAPSPAAFMHIQLTNARFRASMGDSAQQFAVRCRWRTLGADGAQVLPSGRRDGLYAHRKYTDNVLAFNIYRNGRRHGTQHKYYTLGPIFERCDRIDGVRGHVSDLACRGKRHGTRRIWYLSGSLYLQYTYVSGKMHGEICVWYESGQLKNQSMYVDGKLHGNYLEWYKSGQLSAFRTYVAGLRQGDVYVYFELAQLQIQGACLDDKLHGDILYYYESGQLAEQCTYVHDIRHGSRFMYREDGQLQEHAIYVDGVKQAAGP